MNKIVQFVKQIYRYYQKHTLLIRAGYKTDQNGIQKRLRREQKKWQPHLENTRNFILDAANTCKHRNQIAILGSGWLNDVPIMELSQMFNHVDLYDVIHPEQIVKLTHDLINVRHISIDLTGGLIAFADQCKSYSEFTRGFDSIKLNIDLSSYNLVVSVNLLNQLDILLCDFLVSKFRINTNELAEIRDKIQTAHIRALPLHKSCLITDYIELKVNKNNQQVAKKDLIYTALPSPIIEKEWLWHFDSHRLYDSKFNTIFKVKAIVF